MNTKPILPTDIPFTHNTKRLILAIRPYEMEGQVEVFCGEKINEQEFDSRIAMSFFQEDFTDVPAQTAVIFKLLNPKIAEQYGAFTGDVSTLWGLVNQITAFINSSCQFNPATGWVVK